jgi:ABC-type transporter Mla subunit MlaD
VSERAERSLMQVEPTRLVELAEESESVLAMMADDWNAALPALSAACDGLGDAAGVLELSTAYADSLSDAGAVVAALAETLAAGVTGLVDAAQDALRADDAVAAELDRAAHQVSHQVSRQSPGHGAGGQGEGGR